MGAGLQPGGALTSRRARRRGSRPMSEINVTPFVDVMLVLLIIFMVTAPLLATGVPVDLPESKAPQIGAIEDPLVISLDKDGRIYMQETEVKEEEIVPKLVAISKSGYDKPIFFRGDWRTNYATLMKVMGLVSDAGFKRFTFVSSTEEAR
jgi:biopolymer transport protein TolR